VADIKVMFFGQEDTPHMKFNFNEKTEPDYNFYIPHNKKTREAGQEGNAGKMARILIDALPDKKVSDKTRKIIFKNDTFCRSLVVPLPKI
jgi:hypothetical protein